MPGIIADAQGRLPAAGRPQAPGSL